MTGKAPHISRVGSVWYYSRRVPNDLLETVGKPFWRQSLRTKDKREASRLAATMAKNHDELIDRMRSGGGEALEALKNTGVDVSAGASKEEIHDGLERAKVADAKWRDRLVKAGMLEANRLGVDVNTMMGFARSADALMNEAHDGFAKTLEKLADTATGKATTGAITGLLDDWKRTTEPARKTIVEAEAAVRRFNELHSDLDANEITPAHIRDFRSALLGMPKHVSRKVSALPLPSLVKWAEDNQAPLIAPQSAVKMLRLVKAILANADDAGLIESNPAAGITIKVRGTVVERLPFDAGQMSKILANARHARSSVVCPPRSGPPIGLDLALFEEYHEMAGKREKAEDIVLKLRQVEVLQGQGMSVSEAVRQIGVTQQTFYRWRRQYGGMNRDQLKRLKELEKENGRLRRAVSDLTLDKMILTEAARGNF